MIDGIKRRFGLFFTLIGAVTLALFFSSDAINQPNLGYLLWGAVSTSLGILLLRTSRTPPTESQRFRLVRRLFANQDEENDAEG